MNTTTISLVTGGNRGIGREVCRQLSALGHTVILSARNRAAGEKVAEELGERVHFHPLDVSDPESIAASADWVAQQFGRLDVLVNNAGIDYDMDQEVLTADLQRCLNIMDVNCFGPWRTAQAFLPLLRKSNQARIVNVSSGAGALADQNGSRPGYSLSKGALNLLTMQLSTATSSDGILVNAVCPGWVRTDMGGAAADRSVTEGANGVVWAATLPVGGPSGGFFRDGQSIDW